MTLPEGFKYWRPGACVPAALLVLDQLVEYRDWIIEGEVKFAIREAFNTWYPHTWMEVDGAIYDPTLVQFKYLKTYQTNRVQRLIVKRYSVSVYRKQLQKLSFDKLDFWNNRIREFGGVMTLR